MDHAITIRDLCWAGGGLVVIGAAAVFGLWLLAGMSTDL